MQLFNNNLEINVYICTRTTVDSGVEARFESGNKVGDLAMGLFGKNRKKWQNNLIIRQSDYIINNE